VDGIFQIDEQNLPWMTYRDDNGDDSAPPIRVKALSRAGGDDVPSMQYVDYPPGYVDPVHTHDTGEWMIITAGSMRFGDDEPESGVGSAVFVPRDTPYAIHAGEQGVRYFRIVVP